MIEITITSGMPASAAHRSQVRQRWKALAISTRNIDALHQIQEDILQRVPFGDQGLFCRREAYEEAGLKLAKPKLLYTSRRRGARSKW